MKFLSVKINVIATANIGKDKINNIEVKKILHTYKGIYLYLYIFKLCIVIIIFIPVIIDDIPAICIPNIPNSIDKPRMRFSR